MAKQKEEATLQELEDAYHKAANALTEYRHDHGFEPGAKVICRFQKQPEKRGVIAPFGEAWATVMHMQVPVILDSGILQPWSMSDLSLDICEPCVSEIAGL